MTPIREPVTAGIIVSLLNRFLLPRLVLCFEPLVETDDHESSDSSESSAISADTEVHIHTH